MSWREQGCEVSGECQEIDRKEDEVQLSLSKHTWEMTVNTNKVAFSRIAKGKIRLEMKGGNEACFLFEVIICSLGPPASVLIIYCASDKIIFRSSFGLSLRYFVLVQFRECKELGNNGEQLK